MRWAVKERAEGGGRRAEGGGRRAGGRFRISDFGFRICLPPSPLSPLLSPLRCCPRHNPLSDAAKAEGVEQRQCRVQIDMARAAGVPVDLDRNANIESDQVAAQQGLVAELLQVFSPLGPRHVAGMVEDRFQRAVLFEQLPGKLRPHQRHARHVIHRVAHQRLKIDHLLRRDSPLGLKPLAVENLVLADVEQLHAVGNQLPTVLVGGDNEALAIELFGHSGDGGQDVVGLVRLAAERRNAQCGDHATDRRNLRDQVLGHFRPLNLVLVVHRVTEGLAGQVERREEVVWPLLLQQIEQIASEAEHRAHGLASRAGHLRQGMKHLMNQRVGVDDPDRLAAEARRGGQRRTEGGGRRAEGGRRDFGFRISDFGFTVSPSFAHGRRLVICVKAGQRTCRVRSFMAFLVFTPRNRRGIVRQIGSQRNAPPPSVTIDGLSLTLGSSLGRIENR